MLGRPAPNDDRCTAAPSHYAIIYQLLYAGLFVQVTATAAELRQAGELIYYAGDVAELILAFAMVTAWRPSPSS